MGPDRNKHLRNIAIVLVLALAVWKLPGGGKTSSGILSLLLVILWGGVLFFGYRLYMENRMTIHSLDDRLRALLYGSLALIVITLGLILIVVNAAMVAITAGLSEHLDCDSFCAALLSAILIGVFSWLGELFLPGRRIAN